MISARHLSESGKKNENKRLCCFKITRQCVGSKAVQTDILFQILKTVEAIIRQYKYTDQR